MSILMPLILLRWRIQLLISADENDIMGCICIDDLVMIIMM